MSRRIVIIDHPVGQRDDRVSQILSERGYVVDWCRPAAGDSLPDPDGAAGYAAALVYGGAEDLSKCGEVDYIQQEVAWMRRWVDAGNPVLGLCLGSQMLAQAFGGRVAPHPEGQYEIGYVEISPTPAAEGFLDQPMHVYHWHKEGFQVPENAELLATGPVFPQQAFQIGEQAYGFQFHPEVSPSVFKRWIREAGHMLAEPGAQPSEKQLADSEIFDPHLEAWVSNFLSGWLKDQA